MDEKILCCDIEMSEEGNEGGAHALCFHMTGRRPDKTRTVAQIGRRRGPGCRRRGRMDGDGSTEGARKEGGRAARACARARPESERASRVSVADLRRSSSLLFRPLGHFTPRSCVEIKVTLKGRNAHKACDDYKFMITIRLNF